VFIREILINLNYYDRYDAHDGTATSSGNVPATAWYVSATTNGAAAAWNVSAAAWYVSATTNDGTAAALGGVLTTGGGKSCAWHANRGC
jgi:hypothetical protein